MKIKVDSDKIRLWRKERYWSQEDVAEKAGVSLRTIQRIENGGTASNDSALSLANVFDVHVSDFTFNEDEQATEKKQTKVLQGLKMSFGIHLIGFVIGMVTFLAIELSGDNPTYYSMIVPAAFWLAGLVAHGATVVLVWFVQKMQQEMEA